MDQASGQGRVAVVTGGAKGIGQAIARRLHRDGARIALWDIDGAAAAAAAANLGDDSEGFAVDVTDEAAVAAALRDTRARFARIDILVNNAGISGPTVPLVDYAPAEWRRILDIDLTGVFLCCRAVAPLMVAGGWGRIVNLASLAGKEGTPNAAAYSAAKAGVLALTKSLGKELAGSGVLVNAVAPAAIETELLEQMTPAHVETMLAKSPMRRFGTVEEVAALVAWLAGDECSFNTGAVFDLSGGRAVY